MSASQPGLVAVGDSIVNGHTDSMARVPGLSWAQWLADSMDLSYTRYARGGATSTEIVDGLLPRVRDRYAVGVFNMGTNDALRGLDLSVLEANLDKAAAVLAEVCDRVLVLTVPVSTEATALVRAAADRHRLIAVDAEVSGPRLLAPDGVHPTALGHLAIAGRAAATLGVEPPSRLAVNNGQGRLGAGYYAIYAGRWGAARAKRVARTLLSPLR